MFLLHLIIYIILAYFSNGEEEKKVICYTRHGGTLSDFQYFYNRATSRRMLEHVNPTSLFNRYGMDVGDARVILENNDAYRKIMQRAEAIIVSDTIPDGIPFLLEKIRYPNITTKIFLQVTNRFDYKVDGGQKKEFYEFMQNVDNIPGVYWIINNPWEAAYMRKRGVRPKEIHLIRPFGHSEVPARHDIDAAIYNNTCVHPRRTVFDRFVFPTYAERFHIHEEREQYGGPKTLAKFKCLIFFPYQVSVMKMAENMAEGVLTLIPTPKFLYNLTKTHPRYLPDVEEALADNAVSLIEYYNPRYRQFFYEFDSYEELGELVKKPIDQLDSRNIREKMKFFAFLDREEQYTKMYELMKDKITL